VPRNIVDGARRCSDQLTESGQRRRADGDRLIPQPDLVQHALDEFLGLTRNDREWARLKPIPVPTCRLSGSMAIANEQTAMTIAFRVPTLENC